MTSLALPISRFREVGATDAEIEALEMTFERSDVIVQKSWADELKAKSRAGLRIYVEDLREEGFFDETPRSAALPGAVAALEPDQGPTTPKAATGPQGAVEDAPEAE